VSVSRDDLHAAWARLRRGAWPVAQAAIAAALAWWITHDVLGHPQPFFAPIAAAISLSATVGRRWRNAVQMIFGVTLGIVVAEAVVAIIGPGVFPLALIVALAMGAAVLFSPQPMFVNQAAASAILVVTLQTGGVAGERLIDALIGGGCALLVSLLLFPPHPLPILARAIRSALSGTATALHGAAEVLRNGVPHDAEWTVEVTHALHERLAALATSRAIAMDIVRLAPLRRRYRSEVERANERAANVGLLANTSLTLVRLSAAVLEDAEQPPETLTEGVNQLADATELLARGASPDERRRVRELATAIAERGTQSYGPPAVAAAEIQLRAAASDLLRVMRDEDEDAAWQHAVRVRTAVRSSPPAEAARTARRAAARSGAGAFRKR
jgi:uncharacterized membrane protein YgaE (UPF0421/DUF939 family)